MSTASAQGRLPPPASHCLKCPASLFAPRPRSAAYKTFISAAFELSADCSLAWSASAASQPDVVAEALEMPSNNLPGLLVLTKGLIKNGRAVMKLPRNKAEFTVDAIQAFVSKNL